MLKELVIKELFEKLDKQSIDLAIEKIQEVYTIILMERTMMLNK